MTEVSSMTHELGSCSPDLVSRIADFLRSLPQAPLSDAEILSLGRAFRRLIANKHTVKAYGRLSALVPAPVQAAAATLASAAGSVDAALVAGSALSNDTKTKVAVAASKERAPMPQLWSLLALPLTPEMVLTMPAAAAAAAAAAPACTTLLPVLLYLTTAETHLTAPSLPSDVLPALCDVLRHMSGHGSAAILERVSNLGIPARLRPRFADLEPTAVSAIGRRLARCIERTTTLAAAGAAVAELAQVVGLIVATCPRPRAPAATGWSEAALALVVAVRGTEEAQTVGKNLAACAADCADRVQTGNPLAPAAARLAAAAAAAGAATKLTAAGGVPAAVHLLAAAVTAPAGIDALIARALPRLAGDERTDFLTTVPFAVFAAAAAGAGAKPTPELAAATVGAAVNNAVGAGAALRLVAATATGETLDTVVNAATNAATPATVANGALARALSAAVDGALANDNDAAATLLTIAGLGNVGAIPSARRGEAPALACPARRRAAHALATIAKRDPDAVAAAADSLASTALAAINGEEDADAAAAAAAAVTSSALGGAAAVRFAQTLAPALTTLVAAVGTVCPDDATKAVLTTPAGTHSGAIEHDIADALAAAKEQRRAFVAAEERRLAKAGLGTVRRKTTVETDEEIETRLLVEADDAIRTKADLVAKRLAIAAKVTSTISATVTVNVISDFAAALATARLPAASLAAADVASALASAPAVATLFASIVRTPLATSIHRAIAANDAAAVADIGAALRNVGALASGLAPAVARALWPYFAHALAHAATRTDAALIALMAVHAILKSRSAADVAEALPAPATIAQAVLAAAAASEQLQFSAADRIAELFAGVVSMIPADDIRADASALEPIIAGLRPGPTADAPAVASALCRALAMAPIGYINAANNVNLVFPVVVAAADLGAESRLAPAVTVRGEVPDSAEDEVIDNAEKEAAGTPSDLASAGALALAKFVKEDDDTSLATVAAAAAAATTAEDLVAAALPFFLHTPAGATPASPRRLARAAVRAVALLARGLDRDVARAAARLFCETARTHTPTPGAIARGDDPTNHKICRAACYAAALELTVAALALAPAEHPTAATDFRDDLTATVFAAGIGALADPAELVLAATRRFTVGATHAVLPTANGVQTCSRIVSWCETWAQEAARDGSADFAWSVVAAVLGAAAADLPTKTHTHAQRKALDVLVRAIAIPSRRVQAAAATAAAALLAVLPDDTHRYTTVRGWFDTVVTAPDAANLGPLRGAACGLAACVRVFGTRWMFAPVVSGAESLWTWITVSACAPTATPDTRMAAAVFLDVAGGICGTCLEPFLPSFLPTLFELITLPAIPTPAQTRLSGTATSAFDHLIHATTRFGAAALVPYLPIWMASTREVVVTGALTAISSISRAAPAIAAAALPSTMPHLRRTAISPRATIVAATRNVLADIVACVRSRELKPCLNALTEAVVDPVNKTLPALRALAAVEFTSALDSIAVALIVPVVQRGLTTTDPTVRAAAAAVAAAVAQLAHPADLKQYLPGLADGLRSAITDSNDRARDAVTAAAGALLPALCQAPEVLSKLMDWAAATARAGIAATRDAGARIAAALAAAAETAISGHGKATAAEVQSIISATGRDARFSIVFWLDALNTSIGIKLTTDDSESGQTAALTTPAVPNIFGTYEAAVAANDPAAPLWSPDPVVSERARREIRTAGVAHGHFLVLSYVVREMGDQFTRRYLSSFLPAVVTLHGSEDDLLKQAATTAGSSMVDSFTTSQEVLRAAVQVLCDAMASEASATRAGVLHLLLLTIGSVAQVNFDSTDSAPAATEAAATEAAPAAPAPAAPAKSTSKSAAKSAAKERAAAKRKAKVTSTVTAIAASSGLDAGEVAARLGIDVDAEDGGLSKPTNDNQFDAHHIQNKVQAAFGPALFHRFAVVIFMARADTAPRARADAASLWRACISSSQETTINIADDVVAIARRRVRTLAGHNADLRDDAPAPDAPAAPGTGGADVRGTAAAAANFEAADGEVSYSDTIRTATVSLVDLGTRTGNRGPAWTNMFYKRYSSIFAEPATPGSLIAREEQGAFSFAASASASAAPTPGAARGDRIEALAVLLALAETVNRVTLERYTITEPDLTLTPATPALVPAGAASLDAVVVAALTDPAPPVRDLGLALFNVISNRLGSLVLRRMISGLLAINMTRTTAAQNMAHDSVAAALAAASMDGLVTILESRHHMAAQLLPQLLRAPVSSQAAAGATALARIIARGNSDSMLQQTVKTVIGLIGSADAVDAESIRQEASVLAATLLTSAPAAVPARTLALLTGATNVVDTLLASELAADMLLGSMSAGRARDAAATAALVNTIHGGVTHNLMETIRAIIPLPAAGVSLGEYSDCVHVGLTGVLDHLYKLASAPIERALGTLRILREWIARTPGVIGIQTPLVTRILSTLTRVFNHDAPAVRGAALRTACTILEAAHSLLVAGSVAPVVVADLFETYNEALEQAHTHGIVVTAMQVYAPASADAAALLDASAPACTLKLFADIAGARFTHPTTVAPARVAVARALALTARAVSPSALTPATVRALAGVAIRVIQDAALPAPAVAAAMETACICANASPAFAPFALAAVPALVRVVASRFGPADAEIARAVPALVAAVAARHSQPVLLAAELLKAAAQAAERGEAPVLENFLQCLSSVCTNVTLPDAGSPVRVAALPNTADELHLIEHDENNVKLRILSFLVCGLAYTPGTTPFETVRPSGRRIAADCFVTIISSYTDVRKAAGLFAALLLPDTGAAAAATQLMAISGTVAGPLGREIMEIAYDDKTIMDTLVATIVAALRAPATTLYTTQAALAAAASVLCLMRPGAHAEEIIDALLFVLDDPYDASLLLDGVAAVGRIATDARAAVKSRLPEMAATVLGIAATASHGVRLEAERAIAHLCRIFETRSVASARTLARSLGPATGEDLVNMALRVLSRVEKGDLAESN